MPGADSVAEQARHALELSMIVMEGGDVAGGQLGWDDREKKVVGRKTCQLVDAADFDNNYIVIDDAQLPYECRPFGNLSAFDWMRPQAYLVPMHRSMVLDAVDAHANGMSVLRHEKVGVLNWAKEEIEDGERVIVRMFMCSSRGYKRERVKESREIACVYEELVLPHFIWVFELYHAHEYFVVRPQRRAFGELILDSTSAGADNPLSKVLFMRYPLRMYVRTPEGGEEYMPIKGNAAASVRHIKPFEHNLRYLQVI